MQTPGIPDGDGRNGNGVKMYARATTDAQPGEKARQAAIYACMRWRDENVRATQAYRAWADADTANAWRAYEDAFDREHEALTRYLELAQQVEAVAPPGTALSSAVDPSERSDGAGRASEACSVVFHFELIGRCLPSSTWLYKAKSDLTGSP
jgi:hypothetical protein